MFVLTGPENSSLNRVPVVTFTLLGLIALILLVTVIVEPGRKQRLNDACATYLRASYLEADPRLLDLIDQHPDMRAYLQHRQVAAPTNPQLIAREQSKLDQLWARAESALNGRPFVALGFKPADPGPVGLLFHWTAHHGTFHALMVMLMLYLTAPFLEDRWGRVFMPLLFLAGSILALLVYWASRPATYAPFHGADAGTATLLGAYLVRYRRERLRYVYLVPLIRRETYSSVWVLLVFWGLFQASIAYFWIGWTQYRYPGILTQILPLGFGMLVSFMIAVFKLEPRLYQTEFEKLPEQERLDIQIARYRQEGLAQNLYETLLSAWRKYPERDDYMRELWSQAVRMDRSGEVLDAGLKLITHCLNEGDTATAYYHWLELTDGHAGQNLPLRQAESLANELMTVGHHLEARNVMAYTVDHMPRNIDMQTLLDLLETARYTDPRLALSAIDRLLIEHSRHADEEQQLRAIRQELLDLFPELHKPVEQKREIEISPDRINPALEDPFAPTRIAQLRVARIVPLALHPNRLDMRLNGKENPSQLPFDQIKAIGAVAIRPVGDAPEMLIDLHLDDPLEDRPQHRVLRIHSRDFDPLALLPQAESRSAAMRQLIGALLTGGAVALPGREELLGKALKNFRTLKEFESNVYGL